MRTAMSNPDSRFRRGALLALSSFLLIATPTGAQDAASIMGEMFTRQQQRYEGIENFTIVQETLGSRIPQYFEAFQVEGMARGFRLVPLSEIERERLATQGVAPPSSGELATMAEGYRMFGDLVASELEREGLPVQLAGLSRTFGGMAQEFVMAAANYRENDGRADARSRITDLAWFARNARLVGTEEVANRPSYHLRVEDFAGVELPDSDVEFDPTGASLWIDMEEYVPLRLLVEGQATVDGSTDDITVEKISHAWNDDEGLFLAHEEIMSLAGAMFIADEEQRAEMQEALDQLDDMEEQLDGLSQSQIDMIMSRMAPQIAQLERMARGEPLTVVTNVVEVRVNEGPPFDLAEIVFGGR